MNYVFKIYMHTKILYFIRFSRQNFNTREFFTKDPVGKSDHATITVNLDVEVYEDVHIERRLYYKGDYKGMRDYFTAINWSRLLAHKSVQETWDIFVKHFTYAINRYIKFPLPQNLF